MTNMKYKIAEVQFDIDDDIFVYKGVRILGLGGSDGIYTGLT